MSNNVKIYIKNEKLKAKLNICYYSTLALPEKNDKKHNINPIFKLLSIFDDIQNILNTGDKNILKFLYFNRIKTHEILYEKEEIIKIIKDSKDLDYNVYLSLLIEENSNVVNYIYSFELIKNLNVQQTKEKERKIRRIILAKIILELIANFEQSDNEENADNKISEELKKIKKYNIEVIKQNIIAFKEFELKEENINSMKIDEIYTEIIKYLILKKKLNGDDKIDDLIKEIDLQSIDLSKIMFDGLSSVLIKNKEYIKEYIIENYEDIFDIKKINFYYILLKYILKFDYYIYQIPFLLETKNKIIKIIKANIAEFNHSLNQKRDYLYKIEYVLKCFIEFKYYINKSIKVNKEKMESTSRMVSNSSNPSDSLFSNNMLNYGIKGNQENSSSSGYFSGSSFKKEKEHSGRNFEGYEEETKSEFEILKEQNKNDITFRILTKSIFFFEFYKEDNDETKEKFSGIKIQGEYENINFETIQGYNSTNEIINNNYKNLLDFLKNIINKIKTEFVNNFKFKVAFNFISNYVEKNIFQMNCFYQLEISNEKPTEFKDLDIFKNEDKEGITFLINEINARRD